MKTLLKKLMPAWLVMPLLPSYHLLRAFTANVINGFPARGLKVIGVTGTNGKTTTIRFLAEILKQNGAKVGYATSVDTVIGDEVIDENTGTSPSPTTTRDVFAMQKLLKRMKNAEVDVVILEVTSHALAQNRALGIPIDTAILTNISEDHMDYHGTMEKYLAAKAKLFKKARRSAVINLDDDYFDYFSDVTSSNITSYGKNQDADVELSSSEFKIKKTDLEITFKNKKIKTGLGLPGEFNAYNALAAAAAGFSLGIKGEVIEKGLAGVEVIPGRMETFDSGKGFDIIIDYAHTPDAFSNVLSSVKKLASGRLVAVFGGAAQHDYEGLGKVAGKLADVIVVTDDEPENMDPEKIRKVIIQSASNSSNGKSIIREIPDRKEGIKEAFELAEKDDVVMLLCLGHQTYRRVGNKRVPWNERETAEKVLNELK